MMTSNTGEL